MCTSLYLRQRAWHGRIALELVARVPVHVRYGVQRVYVCDAARVCVRCSACMCAMQRVQLGVEVACEAVERCTLIYRKAQCLVPAPGTENNKRCITCNTRHAFCPANRAGPLHGSRNLAPGLAHIRARTRPHPCQDSPTSVPGLAHIRARTRRRAGPRLPGVVYGRGSVRVLEAEAVDGIGEPRKALHLHDVPDPTTTRSVHRAGDMRHTSVHRVTCKTPLGTQRKANAHNSRAKLCICTTCLARSNVARTANMPCNVQPNISRCMLHATCD
jgi:hypothetical protein